MPFIFWALDAFDWMDDHEEPPYVFAATGPFFHPRIEEPSQQATYCISSSILFFSNGILDPGCLPTSLSIAYTLFHVWTVYF